MDQARFRYFVRVAGSCRNKEQDVKRAFGKVEVVELYGMDEFAVLTSEMSEGEFRAAATAYDLSLIHIFCGLLPAHHVSGRCAVCACHHGGREAAACCVADTRVMEERVPGIMPMTGPVLIYMQERPESDLLYGVFGRV